MDLEFYKQLKAFLKEIIQVFPDDHEIKIISTKINLSTLEKDIKLINKFYSGLSPLEDLILTQDDSFFSLNPGDYWIPGSNEFNLFTKLMFYWSEVDTTNKKVMWDYLTLLYKLSKCC
jgi:hypothetical protein